MNKVHLYTSTLSVIYDKLDIVRRYGEDVTDFEERIESAIAIAESIDDPVSTSGNVAVQRLQNDTKYTEALNQLREIEKELDEYTKYLVLYFKNKSIENELSKGAIIDNVRDYRKEIEKLLIDARNINIRSIAKGSELVISIYKTAYEIIKIELIQNGESKLLEHMIKNQDGIEFINDFIREELQNIDLNDEKNSDIKAMVDELSSVGINYNYADERLILSILLRTDSRVLESINVKMEHLQSRLEGLLKSKDKAVADKYDLDKLHLHYIDKARKNRIKSIVMSIMMFLNLGLYKAGEAITKNACTDTQYMTTREVYDTVNNETKSVSELEYKHGDNIVVLKQYGEVRRDGKRNVKTYNLDYTEFDNIEDFVNYDTSGETATTSSTIDYSMAEQLSKDEYTIVESKSYSEEPTTTFNEKSYNNITKILMYGMMSLSGIQLLMLLRYISIYLNTKVKDRKLRKTISTLDNEKDFLYGECADIRRQISELKDMKLKGISDSTKVDEYTTKVHHKHKKGKKHR
ncbi:MAG: hypothetical protein IJK66_01080 [Bacilli bacterium]|nr:hypothetical protein [Bacilli bacterium]